MPIRLGGWLSQYATPAVPPPEAPKNLFEPLQEAVTEERRLGVTRRGQDLQAKASEASIQQAAAEERGRGERAALSAGLQREEMEQRAAMESARLRASQEADKTKRDDELFKEFGAARWAGDQSRTQIVANELKRRGFQVASPAAPSAPTAEPATPEEKPTKREMTPGEAKLSQDLEQMETKILGGLGVPKAKAETKPVPLGQVAPAGKPTELPSVEPEAVAPTPVASKGYEIRDQQGNVIWEDDDTQIRSWQQKKVQEAMMPLLAGARDPAELHAAKLALQTADERLQVSGVEDAIKAGNDIYRFSIERERFRKPTGKGGVVGPTKADKFGRQMEVQDREYVERLVKDEQTQQKLKDLRQLVFGSSKALEMSKSPRGTVQRQALIGALQDAQKGMLSNMDLEFGKNAEGLMANLETAINTLTGGGELSDAQLAGLKDLATLGNVAAKKKISQIADAAERRILMTPGMKNSPDREAYAQYARETILGASGAEEDTGAERGARKPLDAKDVARRIQGIR